MIIPTVEMFLRFLYYQIHLETRNSFNSMLSSRRKRSLYYATSCFFIAFSFCEAKNSNNVPPPPPIINDNDELYRSSSWNFNQWRQQQNESSVRYFTSAKEGELGDVMPMDRDDKRGRENGKLPNNIRPEKMPTTQERIFNPGQQQQFVSDNGFKGRTPIHYPFPAVSNDGEIKDDGSVEKIRRRYNQEFESPRRDAVTRYISTKKGKAIVTASASAVGLGVGAFIGKAVAFGKSNTCAMALVSCALFFVLSFTRGAYGEFVKALGLAMVLLLQRTKRIRHLYPTFTHVKSIMRAGPRCPFPPAIGRIGDEDYDDNPWAYRPIYEDDVEFRMLQSLIAMVFIGSICGGTLPIIPSWLGALIGAATFAFMTTLRDSKVRTLFFPLFSMLSFVSRPHFFVRLLIINWLRAI